MPKTFPSAIMMSSLEYEDPYRRGCTLIWDSGRFLSNSQRNGSKRKVYLIEGNFLQKSRVLSKIKYFESKDTVKMISKTTRKLRIQFDDKAVSTHEYQSETSALAQYLEENPHEKDVVEKEQADLEQTSISLDLENSESSDDVVETPRDTVAMKSNTAIGAGELSNYKSKIQLEEFQFGMSMAEPEPSPATTQETEVNQDLDLLPAEDENSIHFTGTETSDMLF